MVLTASNLFYIYVSLEKVELTQNAFWEFKHTDSILYSSKSKNGLGISVGDLSKQSHCLHNYTVQILEKQEYNSLLNGFNICNYQVPSENNPVHNLYNLEVEDFDSL